MSSVACCMIDVVRTCCPSLVACCMLPPGAHALRPNASRYARARARNVNARALFVRMAVADEAVGRKASVALRTHSALATAATAHDVHSSCTASIAAERCRLAARADRGRLQRCREGAAGRRDGGAPGRLVRRAAASLQGTPQRRRRALVARIVHRACCASPAHHLLAAAARDPMFGSTLFVALYVGLLVWSRPTLPKHAVDGAAYAAHAPSIRGLLRSVCSGSRCSSP